MKKLERWLYYAILFRNVNFSDFGNAVVDGYSE